MIRELEKVQYERVRPMFEGWRFNIRVNSLIDGYSPGKIYVDSLERPRTAIAWVKDLFHLAGDEENRHFNDALNRWIAETIAPQATRVGLDYFAVQVYPLKQWESKIRDLLQDRNLRINYEWKHILSPKRYRKIRHWKAIPSGFAVSRVDRALLAEPHCEAIFNQINRSCVSVDRFAEQGLGFCMRRGKVVISSCYSAYVSGNVHEIGIDTFNPEHRNQGFATLTAKAFIDRWLANDLTLVWSADEINAPSIALAKKLGFEKVGEYPDYYFTFQ